jgi:hypothetical protein
MNSELDLGKKLSLWATHYNVPIFKNDKNGLSLLDKNEKETGFNLPLCK